MQEINRTITSEEIKINIKGGQHVRIKNYGDGTIYVSKQKNIIVGSDNVIEISAGEVDIIEDVCTNSIVDNVMNCYGTIYMISESTSRVAIRTQNHVNFSRFAKGGGLADKITIEKLDVAEDGFSSSYQLLIDDKAIGDKINIPKNLVVESGSVKTVESENTPVEGYVVGDKYIDLVIANSDDEHIYILVSDLIAGVGEYYFVNDAKKGEIFNDYAHNRATGIHSHAEGNYTTANGEYAHAEGNGTIASSSNSHAEGGGTKASGGSSHAEGASTVAGGSCSHAEGASTSASGSCAHAEGNSAIAKGSYSHAGGYGTIAAGEAQTAIGKYNVKDTENKYAFIIGNGDSSTRSNVLSVSWDGSLVINNVKSTLDTTLIEGLKYQIGELTEDITITLPEGANSDIEVDFAVCDTIYNITCSCLSLNVVNNTYYKVLFCYDKTLKKWFSSVLAFNYTQ